MTEKLNRCLVSVDGLWIARMDDDFSNPDRLEKQLSWLISHKDYSYVGCSVELERDGETIGIRKLP